MIVVAALAPPEIWVTQLSPLVKTDVGLLLRHKKKKKRKKKGSLNQFSRLSFFNLSNKLFACTPDFSQLSHFGLLAKARRRGPVKLSPQGMIMHMDFRLVADPEINP